eukprot:TRINITY_DN14371_c0_g3_i2.p1 TRINITY_DN14371_c0_g3~~TRINITY_DN14371_c0_g3_i2.p1  ORF type:complete len:187 (+),score=21.16 TRINITY_DN14371_c0_g3_i2:609-1169(+)
MNAYRKNLDPLIMSMSYTSKEKHPITTASKKVRRSAKERSEARKGIVPNYERPIAKPPKTLDGDIIKTHDFNNYLDNVKLFSGNRKSSSFMESGRGRKHMHGDCSRSFSSGSSSPRQKDSFLSSTTASREKRKCRAKKPPVPNTRKASINTLMNKFIINVWLREFNVRVRSRRKQIKSNTCTYFYP